MTTPTNTLPTVNPNHAKVSALTSRSTVFIDAPTDAVYAQRKVAEAYVFGCDGESVGVICEANTKIAHEHGQWNHERVWRILSSLFLESATNSAGPTKVARKIIDALYAVTLNSISRVDFGFHRYKEYCASHDVQMLAMLGIILLRAFTLPSDTGKHFIYSLEYSF
jgi:hypothetical protein